MAYQAMKTEHAGSKRGKGAFWGRKRDAKRQSNRKRRAKFVAAIRKGVEEFDQGKSIWL